MMLLNKLIKSQLKISSRNSFLAVSSVFCLGLPMSASAAQDCALIDGKIAAGCEHSNAGVTVSREVQPNVELGKNIQPNDSGFSMSVDGLAVDQQGNITDKKVRSEEIVTRQQDQALAEQEVGIKFDGLEVTPRLQVNQIISNEKEVSDNKIRFKNNMNYPAFIERGELIFFKEQNGSILTIAELPMLPNAELSIDAFQEEYVFYKYRVYDAQNRFDETTPQQLNIDAVNSDKEEFRSEQGLDITLERNIPVFGGSITVYGKNMSNQQAVKTLGETVYANDKGSFVVQRILPVGEHRVKVDTGEEVLERTMNIPSYDMFYVGLLDITVGRRLENELLDVTGEEYDRLYTEGRLAFYAHGKLYQDYILTTALDTGYDDLADLVDNFDEKNPLSYLDRLQPNEGFPVYGDDSTREITAPTSGKLFVKVEKDAFHAMWGNFKSEMDGTEYLRNERTLYGAQGVYRSNEQTTLSQPKVEVQAYAAQPDTLPERDVFRGTGGSSYFLKFQDITRGSETILVQIEDSVTGKVVSSKTLVYGQDYDINYLQGLVVLTKPLSSWASNDDLISNNPNGDNAAYLVVNYDRTPTSFEVDSFSRGGAAQAWLNDQFRVGVSMQDENLGFARQKAYGADVLYQTSERSFIEAEVARTEGTGRDQNLSLDGGLTLNNQEGVTGDAGAYRLKGQADLQELGTEYQGVLTGFYEKRQAGFSTLNYRSQADETLWGLAADVQLDEQTTLKIEHDDYKNDDGKVSTETSVTAAHQADEKWTVEGGLERDEEKQKSASLNNGTRTDGAVKVSYQDTPDRTYYGYGQSTLAKSGDIENNNRIGVGTEIQVDENWKVAAEISDGSTGEGGRLLANYDDNEKSSYYFGWSLDPTYEFDQISSNGRDKGSFVVGARNKVTDKLTTFVENTYDLFGESRSLTSVYGADYQATKSLSVNFGMEFGRLDDDSDGSNFDRNAYSVGASYKDEQLTVSGRLEIRQDKGNQGASNKDGETIAAQITSRYKLDESSRLLFNAESISSENESESIPEAQYTELNLGYAYRPIDNDKLNVLTKYSFINDRTSRTKDLPASGANFVKTPKQKAHIVNIDASYDLNNQWTIGGKLGARFSQQDNGDGYISNNAKLGVINLRYHSVHQWDALIEARQLQAEDIGSDSGMLGAVYYHVGNNAKVGFGYNFGRFSDDLSDVTYDDKGAFFNIVGKW